MYGYLLSHSIIAGVITRIYFLLLSEGYEFSCFVFYLYVFCLSLSLRILCSLPLSCGVSMQINNKIEFNYYVRTWYKFRHTGQLLPALSIRHVLCAYSSRGFPIIRLKTNLCLNRFSLNVILPADAKAWGQKSNFNNAEHWLLRRVLIHFEI
jgi:hypothetical protein